MYPALRSVLFRLDSERAHALTLLTLRIAGNLAPSRWTMQALFRAPSKPVTAFGLTFRNPVGLAAGYDKDGLAIRGLTALGFGHLEIGTVTPLPQAGNPKPRLFRLVADEAIINRLGCPSRGSEFVQTLLNPGLASDWLERFFGFSGRNKKKRDLPPERLSGKTVLGVNIAKNKQTPDEQAVLDYLELLQNFAPYADYLAINVSSPETVGLQARAALETLLTQLHAQRLLEQVRLKRRLPLLVKLAPDLSQSELDDAVDAILRAHMDGIIVTNTTASRDGLSFRADLDFRSERGGLSGAPLRRRSEDVLRKVVARAAGAIPIVSVGGIMGPDDALRRLDMGATLVQLYTGLLYRGPGLVKAIVKAL